MRFKQQISTLLRVAHLLLEHGIPPKCLMQALDLPTSVLLDADASIPRRLARRRLDVHSYLYAISMPSSLA